MQVFAVAFAFLLAGVNALPNQQSKELEAAIRSGEPRIITGAIVGIIDSVVQSIADSGLDPLNIESLGLDYAVPVPSVFNARAHIRGVNSRGLSNVVINQINYALLSSRLTFNIELPGIVASVDDSAWDVNVLSANFNGAFSGSVAVRNIVVTGNVRVSIGILSGISIREMDLTANVGSIDSNMNLRVQNADISAFVNKFLSKSVANALKEYERDLNELLSIVALQIVESLL